MKKVDLPEKTQMFVNLSLCPYYKSLWSKSKSYVRWEKSTVSLFQTAQ